MSPLCDLFVFLLWVFGTSSSAVLSIVAGSTSRRHKEEKVLIQLQIKQTKITILPLWFNRQICLVKVGRRVKVLELWCLGVGIKDLGAYVVKSLKTVSRNRPPGSECESQRRWWGGFLGSTWGRLSGKKKVIRSMWLKEPLSQESNQERKALTQHQNLVGFNELVLPSLILHLPGQDFAHTHTHTHCGANFT